MGNFAKIVSVGLILFITSIMGVHTVMDDSTTDGYEWCGCVRYACIKLIGV